MGDKQIESIHEVRCFLSTLEYALCRSTTRINFQKDRVSESKRDRRYTNRYTLAHLFPNEDDVKVLKRELRSLATNNYIESVTDSRFPNRSKMRVFGKKYDGDDVYIKIRVELLSNTYASSGCYVFVMSFHYALSDFVETDFPYRSS